MATSTAIPLSALFPPSDTSPPAYFPSPSFALLGPLPPTTPIHLSLNFLALSQLPDYIDAPAEPVEGGASAASIGEKERALIITGPKTTWTENVMEEDEPWLRTHGSEYTALSWLRRVDVRACPTIDHLRLLLTLLGTVQTAGTPQKGVNDDVVSMPTAPGLIVLWDIGRMLMEQVEDDENLPPDAAAKESVGEWRFKPAVALSDYMDIVSTARAAQQHFSTLRPKGSPTQLIILEPHIDRLSTLPILKPAADLRQGLATPTREKRVSIQHGLEWLFGSVVGLTEREGMLLDGVPSRYAVSMPGGEVYHALRKPCKRDEFANPRGTSAEIDQAWQWEWAM